MALLYESTVVRYPIMDVCPHFEVGSGRNGP
jgi:hypothetical protein